MTRVLIFLMGVLAVSSGVAFAASKLTVTAERSVPGVGREQQALIFDEGKNQVHYVRSSNFLDRPSSSAVLGIRKAKMTLRARAELAIARAVLLRVERRLKFAQKETPGFAPTEGVHQVEYRLNGVPVRTQDQELAKVQQVLESANELAAWSAEKVARVTWSGADRLELEIDGKRRQESVRAFCQQEGKSFDGIEKWRCMIPGFGVAYLKPPEASRR